jgi:uncharacterized protein DUF4389
MGYPIHVTIEPRAQYSRATTIFRLVLVIPHLIVLLAWSVVVLFTVIGAWFALLFTARYPQGLFRFHVAFLSYATRVNCFCFLLSDRFPPFGGGDPMDGYPIRVSAERAERQSRLQVGFRLLLVWPATIVSYYMGLVGYVMAVLAWFVILFTGRIPDTLWEIMELPQRYAARVAGYGALLLTDAYPWFQEESDPGVGPVSQFDQPLPPPALS